MGHRLELALLGTHHLEANEPSLFRDAAQRAAVMTKLGIGVFASVEAPEALVQRAKQGNADMLLWTIVLGMDQGRGLARVGDAIRSIDAPRLQLLADLMIAAKSGFDSIDLWVAA